MVAKTPTAAKKIERPKASTASTSPALRADDSWISPAEVMERVFDNPAKIPGFGFAVVRRKLGKFTNTAPDYARAKLQPRRPTAADRPSDGSWPITARQWEVLLPTGVSDDYLVPELLYTRYQQELQEDRPELLLSLTLHFDRPLPRHEMIMLARMFAVDHLVRARRLSTLFVLHQPGDLGSLNAPHVHLLATARQQWPSGWGGYVTEVLRDDGQQLLFDEWRELRDRW